MYFYISQEINSRPCPNGCGLLLLGVHNGLPFCGLAFSKDHTALAKIGADIMAHDISNTVLEVYGFSERIVLFAITGET